MENTYQVLAISDLSDSTPVYQFKVVHETKDMNEATAIKNKMRMELYGDRLLAFCEATTAPYVRTVYGLAN